MSEIVDLISNTGFPIAVSLICMYYIYKQSIAHKEEIATLYEAINNNTLALTELRDKLTDVSRETL